jgi:hypothetical protein
MSNVLRRATAMVAVMTACLAVATSALPQMPTSPWKKDAPFPEPDEELYGVTTNGKLCVFGGWNEGKAPRPVKRGSAVGAEVGGKIHVIGGATTVEGSKDAGGKQR